MRERIVLIGAGSAVFTRGLLADLVRWGEEADVALVDIDERSLEVAVRLAEKMVELGRAQIRDSGHTDRRECLGGATVVICTIAVGGRDAWRKESTCRVRTGSGCRLATPSVAGSSRALRMIPAMVAIAEDTLDLAPDALFFNYGNPMAAVCRGVRKATGAPMAFLPWD